MLRLRLVIAAVIALIALPHSATAAAPPGFERLRPQSPRMTTWLTRGLLRSPTMRALAERVEHGDVIVYLEIVYGIDPAVAACVSWMAATPSARYVRVSLRPNLREADAIAMIAHELQHVVEVIDHPGVVSADTLAGLYARIGHRTGYTGLTWDTLAALRAGDTARLEVVRGTT